MLSAEDDVVSSSSSDSHSTDVPNSDKNRPTPRFFFPWPTPEMPALPLINVLRTKGLSFSAKTTKKMDYSDDGNNSKKTEQQVVRTEPSSLSAHAASPTTTRIVTVMAAPAP